MSCPAMQSDYKQQHKKNVIFSFAKYKKDDEPDRDCIVLIDAEFMQHFENKKGNSRTRNELSALTLVTQKSPLLGPKLATKPIKGVTQTRPTFGMLNLPSQWLM